MIANFPRAHLLPLYAAAQVRELDRLAIEDAGIPGYTLMQRAGEAAWSVLRSEWPEARSIVVLCGTGNNGGDGYVVARHALDAGYRVLLQQLGDTGRIQGDALKARDDYLAAGGHANGFNPEVLADADVVVDALLGTGLERPLEGLWLEAVEAINRSHRAVLSIDIPSGLNADNGTVLGTAVNADNTVTFIGRKQGLYTGMGPEYAGEVTFCELQVPREVFQQIMADACLIPRGLPGALMHPRSRATHKGDYGHVLVIGGDHGMNGAVQLAGMAALRSGAGLVSIATRREHAAVIAAAAPELMSHGVADGRGLQALLSNATVVLIGPGLGQSRWARELLATVLEVDLPLIVDADGLNLLAREPLQRGNWLLTPHPGEAARLLGQTTREIQSQRFASVRALAERYGGVVVLKGAGSLVTARGTHVGVCAAGNPGMASGGMGDVLGGVIAALVAQGLELAPAAAVGVCVHALAGDRVAARGERGMIARDVVEALREVINTAGEAE